MALLYNLELITETKKWQFAQSRVTIQTDIMWGYFAACHVSSIQADWKKCQNTQAFGAPVCTTATSYNSNTVDVVTCDPNWVSEERAVITLCCLFKCHKKKARIKKKMSSKRLVLMWDLGERREAFAEHWCKNSTVWLCVKGWAATLTYCLWCTSQRARRHIPLTFVLLKLLTTTHSYPPVFLPHDTQETSKI